MYTDAEIKFWLSERRDSTAQPDGHARDLKPAFRKGYHLPKTSRKSFASCWPQVQEQQSYRLRLTLLKRLGPVWPLGTVDVADGSWAPNAIRPWQRRMSASLRKRPDCCVTANGRDVPQADICSAAN